jgi:O-antigen/teichoic acid export membrane protein
MRSRLLWRRSTAALGTWASTGLGIVGTLIAIRILGPADFGRLALVLATAAFFQLLLDLTSEEALVKYGFRYSAREDWGRFRRLLELASGIKLGSALVSGAIVALLAPFANDLFDTTGLTGPLLVAALLPLLQSGEGLAASALVLRGRYDLRGGFLTLSTGLRLVAIAIAAPHGVFATVVALVVSQALTTLAIGVVAFAAIRRFPRRARAPLAEDRPELLRFVLQSSIGTGLLSLRGWIAPILLGLVGTETQVGLFRAAQAPQTGFGALSSPVRLILLTEQTRDWEHGRPEAVLRGLRRYTVGSALLMAAVLVPLELAMPWLVRVFLGADYAPAVDAARIILLVAAIQLVFGWTKSFPVSIGRPSLRILAHGVETLVLIPVLLVLGSRYGATGAAGAVLVSTVAFALTWVLILLRLRREPLPRAPFPQPSELTAPL